MLTFRYHLVTLVAVFLALAIGVVVGSTFVGPAVVESLQNQVEDVSKTLDQRKAVNDRLTGENRELQEALVEASPYGVEGRLDGRSVVLVADRGVSGNVVESTDVLLQQAGATAPGTLWLEPSFALEDEQDRTSLSDALGVEVADAATMQRQAWRRVLEDLNTGAAADGATAALIDAGFLDFQPMGEGANRLSDLADEQFQVLLVSGTDSEVAGTEHLAVMADVLVDRGQIAVFAEEFHETDGGPERGSIVSIVRDNVTRAAAISTVDNIEEGAGRLAAVLAESDASGGVVGHYGTGPGAQSPLPEWPEPS